MLERELLVDQVTRLSKPLGEQAENCQQDRLSLAKKVDRNTPETVQRGEIKNSFAVSSLAQMHAHVPKTCVFHVRSMQSGLYGVQ